MQSKIIQIATGNISEENQSTYGGHALYALCEDGTLWYWRNNTWNKVEPVE